MTPPEYIEALNRNTEALIRVAVVWEKLHKRAVEVAARPAEEVTLNAAGVCFEPPAPTKHADIQAGGFVL